MRIDHNRFAAAEGLDVFLKPIQLLLAEDAQAAGFEVGDVDQADEVNAFIVVAVPALSKRSFAVAIEIAPAVVGEDIVLAGDVKSAANFGAFENMVNRIELGGICEMRGVGGV